MKRNILSIDIKFVGKFLTKVYIITLILICRLMNFPTTNSSGISSVAPGVGLFLLFPVPHGGAFVAFYTLLKLIITYIPR